jgi:hypothetical protein
MVAQMDYLPQDYEMSQPEFNAMAEAVQSITTVDARQVATFQVLLGEVNELTKNRKNLESLVRASLPVFEWANLVILLLIIVACLFFLNDGTLFISLVTAMLATAGVIMLFILRELDNLRWQENARIWAPFQQLFVDLGFLPYYPDVTLTTGRIKPRFGKLRIATYPHPYPSIVGKRVRIVNVTPQNLNSVIKKFS